MENSEEEKFGNAFNIIEGIGAMSLSNIFSVFNGSFKKAWGASGKEFYEKLRSRAAADLILKSRDKINPEKEWQENLNRGINAVSLNNKFYPELLKEIPCPPSLIYFKGNIGSLNSEIFVSVVGTRKASIYGLETAFRLSRDLSAVKINIVSGLALGIDAKAHLGCMAGGAKTFAVLGSGLSRILPMSNYRVAEKIIDSGGALISEYPPEFNAEKWTFPQRNRIIAGLSRLVIIIEAPEKSGALITAKFAIDSNRDIGVVPGEISSFCSKGSNKLLKEGAYPIFGAEDVLEILGIKQEEKEKNIFFDTEEKSILDKIDTEISFDELLQKTGFDIKTLNQKISFLEIKGAIKNNNGYFRKA